MFVRVRFAQTYFLKYFNYQGTLKLGTLIRLGDEFLFFFDTMFENMANDWICVANRKYLFFFNEIIKRQGITESGNIRKKENIFKNRLQ